MSQKVLLSDLERSVYEAVLQLGESAVTPILQESGLKRATVYKTLYALEKRGLVSKREIDKKIHFKPESPSALLTLADKDLQEAQEQKDVVLSLLPAFSFLYTSSTERPVVKVYEGVEGLKQVYLDTLQVGKPISVTIQISEVNSDLDDWLTNFYSKKRAKLKIHSKMIISSGRWVEKFRKRDASEYRTSVVVDKDQFPFQNEVNIYGDKVAFIQNKKEPYIGLVITHPFIAKTMKALFDLAWENATSKTS